MDESRDSVFGQSGVEIPIGDQVIVPAVILIDNQYNGTEQCGQQQEEKQTLRASHNELLILV